MAPRPGLALALLTAHSLGTAASLSLAANMLGSEPWPTLPWALILLPFALGHATTAGVHATKLCLLRREGEETNPSILLVRVRDANESLYKMAQSLGVIASSVLLVAAIASRTADGSAAAGSGAVDEAAPTLRLGLPFSLVCVPIWVAWAAETYVWLRYRKYRNAALQGGLTRNHAAIKIRGHDEIFFYNLMLTLVARMLDGAYQCTWMELFLVVWVQLTLVALLYAICLCICVVGLLLSHTSRYQPALAPYRRVFAKSLLLVSCGSFAVVLYCLFWYNLASRMDGDSSVTHRQILMPLIIKVGPELLSSLVLFTTGGHTTIHDSIRSTTEEGERVQWEREKADYAKTAPTRLVQQSATFFKAVPPAADGTAACTPPHAHDLAAANAAAVGSATAGTSATAAQGETQTRGPRPASAGWGEASDGAAGLGADGRECDICLSAPRQVALLPCGHGGMCKQCAHASVELPGHSCPLCRTRVLMVAELELDAECGSGHAGPTFLVKRAVAEAP